jgi:hypothetical protein
MNRRKLYLSFWDVEMANIPVETPIRRRILSTGKARGLIGSARASGTLVCVANEDLGAPYCKRERESHSQLCKVLREHADIEVHLKDFFCVDYARPLCFAEIGTQSDLLVVDCHYVFNSRLRPQAEAPEASARAEISREEAVRRVKEAARTPLMSIDPDSIQFYLFEQIEPEAGVRNTGP